MLRHLSGVGPEGMRAQVAAAGLRYISHTLKAVGATTEATYTVSDDATRRLILCVIGGSDGDVTFAVDETADANSMPLLNGVYVPLDAGTKAVPLATPTDTPSANVLHLYNTTGSSVNVHILEVQ